MNWLNLCVSSNGARQNKLTECNLSLGLVIVSHSGLVKGVTASWSIFSEGFHCKMVCI